MARRKPTTHRRAAKRQRWLGAGVAVVVVGVAMLLILTNGDEDGDGEDAVGPDPVLGVQYVNFDGSTGTLDRYVGEPLVVNFFASWCTPCLAELPEFEAVAQTVAGDVTFVGLNLQEPPEAGLAVIEQTGITYDVARDPDGSLFTAFEALGMPTTVFIDADGKVARVWSGQLSGQALTDLIEELLL